MRLAVLSDIHANTVALEAVVSDALSLDVDRWWVLGDLVAIGPSPVEALEIIANLGVVSVVAGNTERYVLTDDRPYPHPEDVIADPGLCTPLRGATTIWPSLCTRGLHRVVPTRRPDPICRPPARCTRVRLRVHPPSSKRRGCAMLRGSHPAIDQPRTFYVLSPIRTVRVNHINFVLEDYERVTAHLADVFGGRIILDMPKDAWHANLTDIGRVIFEVFAPHEFFLYTRYGPHFIGIEYQVEDLQAARDVCASRGIRVARELGAAFHSHPADCHGVSLELYEGYFHDSDALHTPMQSAQWWRDEHPLGLDGLRAVTVAVRDLASAVEDFRAVFDSELLYEEARPAERGRAVGLKIADAVLELVAPDGDGPVQRHLLAHSEGIRSTVFGVRDLDQARTCLAERGVGLVPGSAPGRLAIPPEQNLGVIFEFENSLRE